MGMGRSKLRIPLRAARQSPPVMHGRVVLVSILVGDMVLPCPTNLLSLFVGIAQFERLVGYVD